MLQYDRKLEASIAVLSRKAAKPVGPWQVSTVFYVLAGLGYQEITTKFFAD
ncbi:hypothetical protein MHY1_02942 [Methylovirgula sp. HY1]|nr:hypothetical protein MHY1_02942 [Methylovirgula sp. HY1]